MSRWLAVVWPLLMAICACEAAPVLEPSLPSVAPQEAELELSVSRLQAPVGQQVHVALTWTGEVELAALQGRLLFDPQRLGFAGQIPEAGQIAVVNDAEADRGRLRMLALGGGDGRSRMAVLTFRVRQPGYLEGLGFAPERVLGGDGAEIEAQLAGRVEEQPDLGALGEPRFMDGEAWAEFLGAYASSITAAPNPDTIVLGDCTLDGIVDVLDVLTQSLIAVGSAPPPADPEAFESCDTTADGTIDVFDVVEVARLAVGPPSPEGGPPGMALPLYTDWTTATGNSEAAVTDGGRGLTRWCVWPQVLSVVDGRTVGLPPGMGNALAIRSVQGCGHVEYENVFPLPVDGEEQFWAVRYYVMNEPGQTDTKMHPMTFWPVGAIEAVHLGITTSGGGGDWILHPRWYFGGEFDFGLMPGSPQGTRQRIAAGSWVRYEFILHWRNAREFRFYPRVYDLEGNLLWDEYDFRHTDTSLSLGEWYDSSPRNWATRPPSSEDPNHIRTFAFGMGQAGSSGRSYYVADAAFALVNGPDDFIGPGRVN